MSDSLPAATDDWWRTFFAGSAVDSWLQAVGDEPTRLDVDCIEHLLGVTPTVGRLLDVPCGGGRHARMIAERGYRVIGVDLSTEFLREARGEAERRQLDVHWEQRDMRDLPWRGELAGAYCFGNSFGYFAEPGNAEFLKAVARTLQPGARFLLEASYISEVLFPVLEYHSRYVLGEFEIVSTRRYDPLESRLHVEYVWTRAGKSETGCMSARIHSCREVCQMMRDAGFTDLRAYGGHQLEPFQVGSKRLLLLGTRNNPS